MFVGIAAEHITRNIKRKLWGKFSKPQSDRERFGKCEICLEYMSVEYYFSEGDQIICYECGKEYTLVSKSPVTYPYSIVMVETTTLPKGNLIIETTKTGIYHFPEGEIEKGN